MKHTRIALGTFFIVVLAGVLFFAIRLSEGTVPAKPAQAAAPAIRLVSFSDHYRAGAHTVSGSIELPTACTPFTATSTREASSIRIDIDSQADSGVCLALPTAADFDVEADSPATTTIDIYVNGVLATTTP